MITLSPGSLCDVCAEEYGPRNYPHSIPCGHILCSGCCNNIVAKAPPKNPPACPFCREHFTSDDVRLIRIDFTAPTSGWSTPRQCSVGAHAIVDDTGDDDLLTSHLNSKADVKRLESKVARVAAKKCSVEEVTALHKELQSWLQSGTSTLDKPSSIRLSAALLRAILTNYFAHSEATKSAKHVEMHLKDQLEEVEMAKEKLEAELRSLRAQYSHTMQECQALRAELSRFRPGSSLLHTSSASASAPPTPTPRSRATSPTSPTPYSPAVHSPLVSRTVTTSLHSRSASVAPTSAFSYRSVTPSVRSHTPAAASLKRAESVRPSTPHKPRRLSISSSLTPPKVIRSTSNESSSDEILSQKEREQEKQKEKDAKRVQLIQRWIPSLESTSPPTSRSGIPYYHGSAPSTPSTTAAGRSRIISASTAAIPVAPPFRYKTPLSANSP